MEQATASEPRHWTIASPSNYRKQRQYFNQWPQDGEADGGDGQGAASGMLTGGLGGGGGHARAGGSLSAPNSPQKPSSPRRSQPSQASYLQGAHSHRASPQKRPTSARSTRSQPSRAPLHTSSRRPSSARPQLFAVRLAEPKTALAAATALSDASTGRCFPSAASLGFEIDVDYRMRLRAGAGHHAAPRPHPPHRKSAVSKPRAGPVCNESSEREVPAHRPLSANPGWASTGGQNNRWVKHTVYDGRPPSTDPGLGKTPHAPKEWIFESSGGLNSRAAT